MGDKTDAVCTASAMSGADTLGPGGARREADRAASFRILVINPGSTSTKIAVFEDGAELLAKTVRHDTEELRWFLDVQDQLGYRKEAIERELTAEGIDLAGIDIFVGRGGGLVSVQSGAYPVTERLLADARTGMAGQHPAQLGSQICDLYAREYGGLAYIVNAPDVDEYDEISRVSGLSDIYRQCHIHTLNHKEIALRYCHANGIEYHRTNLIICHIGGGISVAAHRQGRMVDGNDIIRGEGPMTPTRAGSLPTLDLLKLCYSGRFTEKEMKDRLSREGGLIDHLGTADATEIEARIARGDTYAQLVYDAMIYQIAKSVGSCAVTLRGELRAIILTGGLANSDYVIEALRGFVDWIAPVVVMAGEFEMEALAAGALRVARGQEEVNIYTGIPVWSGFGEQ
ncbi:MAG: butyrate kinase [Coriobacteriales bacterium]|jgi:butyrate kinase|nr:butyrate kinase [Coriobacteriales bacterium]